MNCAQHTDTAAVAYCRTCGKALCEACKRDVQGGIFCDSCLAARTPGGSYGAGAGNFGASGGHAPPRGPEDASPGLALFLGLIPGVGAFYNGQYLKGFVHVIVMSTLIWMSDHGMGPFAGLLVAAWYFYMVFDAWTTAKARRDGLPIPDPIGLNAIIEGREGTFRQRVEQAGERLGNHVEYAAQNIGQHWHQAGGAAPQGTASKFAAGSAPSGANQSASQGTAQPPPPAGGYAAPGYTAPNATPNPGPGASPNVGPQGTYYSGPEGTNYVPPKEREHSPMGAVVLIGLGVLLLLANLGWYSFHWILRFWPVILIVIGVWLFIQRRRDAR